MSRVQKQPLHQRTLCKARRRNGEPCRNAPINGSTVCRMHGGSAPQVKAAAQVRILQAADAAAARLVSMMQDKTVPAAVQLAAARDLLDRAGLSGKQEVEITVQVPKWEQVANDILVDVEEEDYEEAVVIEDPKALARSDDATLAREKHRARRRRQG